MKKITVFKIIAISALVITCVVTLSSFNFNPEDEIVGVWVHENDPDNKWEFTNTGICRWLDQNNVVQDSFVYSISYTSPQCGHQVQTNGDQFYYLKLEDSEGEEYCYDINVDNETLSINYLGTAGYDLYNKQ